MGFLYFIVLSQRKTPKTFLFAFFSFNKTKWERLFLPVVTVNPPSSTSTATSASVLPASVPSTTVSATVTCAVPLRTSLTTPAVVPPSLRLNSATPTSSSASKNSSSPLKVCSPVNPSCAVLRPPSPSATSSNSATSPKVASSATSKLRSETAAPWLRPPATTASSSPTTTRPARPPQAPLRPKEVRLLPLPRLHRPHRWWWPYRK